MRKKNTKKFDDALFLRVLGYLESDGSWAAHCLETDLVGYGTSFKKALDNLQELTVMQVSFASYKNQPALLDRSAPVEIFEMYNMLLRASIQQFTQQDKLDRKRKVTSIPWPSDLPSSELGFRIAPS